MNRTAKTPGGRGRMRAFGREIWKHRAIYSMTLPALLFFLLFNYFPMFGVIVAFKNFKFSEGLFRSAWMQPLFKNFEFFFKSGAYKTVTRNTLFLNFCFIVFGTIVAVAIAIMINELLFTKLKKVLQAGMLMPYFISWIVTGVFVYSLLNYEFGMVNGLLRMFGAEPMNWYNMPNLWPPILVIISLWKGTGYTSVIYIAVLTGIDPSYFEAAKMDGATKLQQIRYISIPQLLPTITMMVLLSVGKIMNADFGMFYSVVGENSFLYSTADVIDTYVYRTLRNLGDVGMSSAVGLYQSCVAFILVLLSNAAARKFQPDGSLF